LGNAATLIDRRGWRLGKGSANAASGREKKRAEAHVNPWDCHFLIVPR
jgi:hypothetical protein